MRALGRAPLAIISLVAWCAGAHAKDIMTAEEAFRQHYWSAAVGLIDGQCDIPEDINPEDLKMLAIAYFQLQEFDKALPCLKKALAVGYDDIDINIDLNSAMLEVQLAKRDLTEENQYVDELKKLGSCESKEQPNSPRACNLARFGKLRIVLNKCDPKYHVDCQSYPEDRIEAKEELGRFVDNEMVSVTLRLQAANVLIEALLKDGELGPAYQIAESARRLDPDSENAIRYDPFIPENQANSRFKYDLGYRFEYDDNVTFPDDDLATGQGDYRHVLMADLLYERPLRGDWSFYASGHFLQSLHHDLKAFDRTHVAGSVALGHMGQRTGWRIPLELTYVWLDGDAFRNSIAILPGFYIQFGNDFLSHFYVRLQRDDYDWFADTEEDRSGDVAGGGVLLTGQLTRRLQVRSYFEFNRYDSDGVYWSRDEVIAFVHGEFELSARWQTAVAFRYKREDYDNVRQVFAERQLDKSKEIFLNITHKFENKNWWVRGQVSLINHESNIENFDYDRNIYSITLTRDF